MSAPVFISFSSHDRKPAETICKAVEQRGLECWISSRNIGPGENFQEAITRAIRSAKVMILVFSANANNSLEVKKEIALAGRYNVIVVPVRVEDVVPNDALSYELAVRQWIDLFDDWENAIERLVGQLSGIIQVEAAAAGSDAAAAPAVPHAAEPAREALARRRSLVPIAGALAALLLIVLGAAGWYFRPVPGQAPQAARQTPTQPAASRPAVEPVHPAAETPPPAPTLQQALADRLAAVFPRVERRAHEGAARFYAESGTHKALAVSTAGTGHWQTANRPDVDAAIEGALEGCQVQFGEPCVLAAADETVHTPGPEGKWAAHDMPRPHFAGDFDPAEIPAYPVLRERPDVLGYRVAAAPKAVAFHPDHGRMFLITGAANQYAAEQEALKRCNEDPVRHGAGGPCFLYAVDNKVVLPLRLRGPMAAPPAVAAATAPPPIPAAPPLPQVRPAVAAAPHPGEPHPRAFRDCPNCPEMVVLPAGHFEMGATDEERDRLAVPVATVSFERTRHEVAFAKPFALSKFPVTRGEFAAFAKATNFRHVRGCMVFGAGSVWMPRPELNWDDPGFEQTDRDPVVCVHGPAIEAYIGWLRRESGKPYRLASEAEYEYGARAGTNTAFYWGDDPRVACAYENVADRVFAEKFGGAPAFGCRDGFATTAPVGSFRPNPWGLYDMLGNVIVLTQDCWNDSYDGAPVDGSARISGDCGRHTMRGGSWGAGYPWAIRAAHRLPIGFAAGHNRIGFRVALSLP